MVEKFFYLSGRYDIQLTVGDAIMVISVSFMISLLKNPPEIFSRVGGFSVLQENSLLRDIGHVDLDLPDAPEKAPRPPLQPVDPYTRYGPKAEITHIFRAPEKRPPKELSLTFLGLTFLPFLGFLVGVSSFTSTISNHLSKPSYIFVSTRPQFLFY